MAIEDLHENMRTEFEKLQDGGKLLLIVGCRRVLKFNIYLLNFLLHEKKMNGIYICVDVPHTHVDRLLKKYKVNAEGLNYIDAITGLSAGEKEKRDDIVYIENPFNAKMITEAINQVQEDGVKRFIILDNMATLQFYSSEVVNFFKSFIGSVDDLNVSFLMLAVDKTKHKATYDIIRPYCDTELEVQDSWID